MEQLNLGKEIYNYLVEVAGGDAKNIRHLSREEKLRMQSNKSNMTWNKTKEILAANGVTGKLILGKGKHRVTLKLK